MASVDPLWRESLKDKYVHDTDMHDIVKLLQRPAEGLSLSERASVRNFSYTDGALWFHPDNGCGRAARLCVPHVPGNGLRLLVMFESHDGYLHQGVEKSYARLSAGFYWKGMRDSLERYIRVCEACRLIKSKNNKAEGFRGGHTAPSSRWETVALDFITDLVETEEGFDCILVVVDTLTKFVYLVPSCKSDSAEDTAWRLFERVFCVHGMPKTLQSDRDSKWCSVWFRSLMKHFNVRQTMGTSHDHKFNGVVEIVNKTVEVCLRSVLANYPDREFTDYLPLVQFAINSSVHTATKISPYKAMFGVEPCNPSLFAVNSEVRGETPDMVEEFVQFQEGVLQMTRDTLLDSQREVAIFVNKSLKDVQFSEGEKVLLNSKNLSSVHFKRSEKKLQQPFLGPFEIEKKLSDYTYRLKLPKSMSRLHPVFHAVLLKRVPGAKDTAKEDEFRDRLFLEGDISTPVEEEPAQEVMEPATNVTAKRADGRKKKAVQPEEEEEEWFFERILQRKLKRGKWHYLVHWAGYGPEKDSWITKDHADDENALEMIRRFDAECDAKEAAMVPNNSAK